MDRSGVVNASNPIRTVHVGVRGRGAWPLVAMAEDARFDPVAIVSREPDELGDALDSGGIARGAAFRTLGGAIDAVDCDAIVVCTPVELHDRDLRTAFAAGKHVLVEKCLSNQWTEACSLVDEAELAGVELVVAQNYRFGTMMRTLRRLVTSGRYGTPMVIDLALHKYRPAPRQQDYPLAVFWDQGCHHVDGLQAILGPITEVSAQTFSAPWSCYRDDAAVQAMLRFESGAVWTYLVSNVARAMDQRFLLYTERGALDWTDDRWRWRAVAASDEASFGWNEPPVDIPSNPGVDATGEQGVLDAFVDAVTERVETNISGRPNLETLRVCETVQRSAALRRPVSRSEVTNE
jgi:predicted dehydrogenase